MFYIIDVLWGKYLTKTSLIIHYDVIKHIYIFLKPLRTSNSAYCGFFYQQIQRNPPNCIQLQPLFWIMDVSSMKKKIQIS